MRSGDNRPIVMKGGFAIILEELGEVSKAVLEKNEEGILEETVQVAALLQAWVTSRDFFFDTGTDTDC